MNLTDLQVELRRIGDRLERLHSEIERMKPKSEDEQQASFASVNKLAVKAPLGNSILFRAEPSVKKTFLQSLAYLIVSAGQDMYVRLLYLCRLARGVGWASDPNMLAETLYKAGLEFKGEDLQDLTNLPQGLKYVLLVEALTLVHAAPESASALYGAVADMAEIMRCDQEELRVCSAVAKGKLLDNYDGLDKLPRPLKHKWNGAFKDYIPEVWLSRHRELCSELCLCRYSKRREQESFSENFIRSKIIAQSSLKSWDVVQPGQIIFTSRTVEESVFAVENPLFTLFGGKERRYLDEEKVNVVKGAIAIKAPRAGAVFLRNYTKKGELAGYSDEYLAVYVVSPFDDEISLNAWFNTRTEE